MNYARMKPTELTMLRKLGKTGEARPLAAADLALLLRVRSALQEYEASTEQQHTQTADTRLSDDW